MQQRTTLTVSIYYAFIFMGLGTFSSYISLYYVHLSLTTLEITVLATLGSIVAITMQPLWGMAGDRAVTKNRILQLCLLGSGLLVWLIPSAGNALIPLMLGTSVYYAFQCAVNPLSDTIALEQSSKGLFRFSRVRMIGSLGYAAMSAVAGWLFARDITDMFPVYSVLMLTAFAIAWFIPKVEGHQRGKPKVNPLALLRNRKLLVLYSYTFAVFTTLGFFYAFHPIYSYQQGISMEWLGFGILFGCVLEPLYITAFNRLDRFLGIRRILLIVGLVSVVRWILYAVGLTHVTFLVIWALHGGTYILLYLSLAEFVSRHVPDELKTGGQMMNAAVMGSSRIIGSLAGGLYAASFGLQSAFAVCAGICAAAVLVFLWLGRLFSLEAADESQPGTFRADRHAADSKEA